MQRILDFIMPNNCKAELKRLADKNAELARDVIISVRTNREKILHEMSTPSFLKTVSK